VHLKLYRRILFCDPKQIGTSVDKLIVRGPS
jgi:hypothetical protein